MIERLRRIPVYTAVVGALLLAVMAYALVQRNPVGYILATVLLVFVGGPALVILAHARREREDGSSASSFTSEPEQHDDAPLQ